MHGDGRTHHPDVVRRAPRPKLGRNGRYKFIVGLGPGSAQDIAARLFGDQLSKRWGQAVVIENKPGADGIIAINAFVGAHDTHTLLFAASGTFTAHPTQYAKLPYDPSDLVPLARVSSTIIAVSVPTALNVSTLDELVALARKEPGKLNLAPTPGTTEITFDNFLKATNITMTKIPYGDITKALADLEREPRSSDRVGDRDREVAGRGRQGEAPGDHQSQGGPLPHPTCQRRSRPATLPSRWTD